MANTGLAITACDTGPVSAPTTWPGLRPGPWPGGGGAEEWNWEGCSAEPQAQPATREVKKNDSSPNFAKGRNVNTIIIPSQLLCQTYDISYWTFHLTCLIKIHKNDKILIRRFLLSFYTGSIHYRKSWVKLFFNSSEYPLIPIITIFWPQILCKRSFWIDMFSLYNKINRYPDYNYPEKTWVVGGTRNSISKSCI